jgi:Papain-like cysteine protease AvrRpt2
LSFNSKMQCADRLDFENKTFWRTIFMSQIFYDVPLIPQATTMTCWWASARMVVEYHRQRLQQSTVAGGAVGQPNETRIIEGANQGINPGRVEDFARLANLQTTSLSPTPEGLVSLLTQYGPLWYGGLVQGYRGFTGGGHAVVITGCLVNPAGAQVAINDPWQVGQGARLFETFDGFFSNLSAAAPFLHI